MGDNKLWPKPVPPPRRKIDPREIPRTFMSPAYFEESETGLFEMFRDVLIETDQPDGVGGFFREKMGKRIGPLFRCREAGPDEREEFWTSRPDGTRVRLVRVEEKA